MSETEGASARGGARLGSYELVRQLGRGAMGSVFEARAPDGSRVALKLLMDGRNTQAVLRFEREARALARLDDPCVVRFLGAGREGDQAWLAMELAEGEDLAQRLARGTLAPELARGVAEQVARALAHAHRAGVVHRDLKPSNVILAPDGRARVTDFGVARLCEESGLTQTGAVVGTPYFMAPEQIEGARAGEPSDVWALGVLLHQCLTGRPPFDGESLPALAGQILSGTVPPLPAGTPADLEATCRRCLEQDPAARPTAAQVVLALATGRGLKPTHRGRRVGLALIALGLAGALGILAGGQPTAPTPRSPSPPNSPADVSWRPELAPGWEQVWTLARGPAPADEASVLWPEPGRLADPLRGVTGGDDSALQAAFAGRARRLHAGRIEVAYAPPDGCLLELIEPGNLLEGGDQAGVFPGDGSARWVAPDDKGGLRVRLGSARWAQGAVELELRALPRGPGAIGVLSLMLGAAPGPETDWAIFALNARSRQASTRVGSSGYAQASFELGPDWTRLRWAPGAPAGERVRLGEDASPALEQPADRSAPSGYAWLHLAENAIEAREVQVRGRPLSVDRPARTRIPAPGSTATRLAVRFRAEHGALVGGPRLELGATVRHTLTLERDRLVLRRDARPLASAPLAGPPAEGWLVLERDGDVVRGALTDLAAPALALEALDPLPLGAGPVLASYGSSGCTTRFLEAELARGPEDAARRDHDAGRAQDTTPRGRWRAAATELAAAADPTWAWSHGVDLGATRDARRERAAQLAAELERAAAGLSGAAQADAVARAILAWVLADRAAEARAGAERLVELEGTAGADRLDGLETYADAPALLGRLALGHVSAAARRPSRREAATQAVLGVEADAATRGHALQVLSEVLESSDPHRALALLDEAAALTQGQRYEIDLNAARVLTSLGQAEAALARLDGSRAPDEHVYLHELRWRALHQARRWDDAVETLAAMLARGPRRAVTTASSPGHGLGAVLQGAEPGHRALAALLITRFPDLPEGESRTWRERALTWSHEVAPDAPPRARDLARYVEAALADIRAGAFLDAEPRPTAVLVRARLGDASAQAALAQAGREDPLVRSLARTDPQLEAWARAR